MKPTDRQDAGQPISNQLNSGFPSAGQARSDSGSAKPCRTGGSFNDYTIEELLIDCARQAVSARISFVPSEISLEIDEGYLVGCRGTESLGMILVRRRLLSEDALRRALAEAQGRPLGQVLLDAPYNLSHGELQDALVTQALLAIKVVTLSPQVAYRVHALNMPSENHPKLSLELALLEARFISDEMLRHALPLDVALRARRMVLGQGIVLEPDEWCLLSLLNGRRSLRTAMTIMETMIHAANPGDGGGWLRGFRAAVNLLKRGLLESSAVEGLHTLTMKRSTQDNPAIFPADVKPNLVLASLDGVRTAAEIAQTLRFSPEMMAQTLVRLYRDRVIELVHGRTELERLLEEY
jgi:hypothetical protein